MQPRYGVQLRIGCRPGEHLERSVSRPSPMPSRSPSNCPSVICDAGFFDNRYANTTLLFHKSEKLGKDLDLDFRDNI
jgi:hypothetical protein